MVMPPIKTILIDDHFLIHEAVAHLLAGQNEFELSATGTAGDELEPLIERYQPDVVLIDLAIPARPGTTVRQAGRYPVLLAIRRLSARHHLTRFVILSGEFSPALLESALEAGATGYLIKDDGLSTQLPDALRTVHKGGWFFSREAGRHFFGTRRNSPSPANILTPRQVEILRTIVAHPGLSHADQAHSLGISEDTFRNHLRAIYEKLSVTTLTAAILRAIQSGVIPLEELTRPPE
jgi:DNA-binding NarL/FixJ family response regulator